LYRYSADIACACKPSPLARIEAISPSLAAPCFDTWMRLLRFWKSYTPNDDEKQAQNLAIECEERSYKYCD